MKKQVKSTRLAQLRVSDELFKQLLHVCEMQQMSLADVRRAALTAYVSPPVNSPYPVVGQIVPDGEDGDKVILFPDRFGLTEKWEAYLEGLCDEAA